MVDLKYEGKYDSHQGAGCSVRFANVYISGLDNSPNRGKVTGSNPVTNANLG